MFYVGTYVVILYCTFFFSSRRRHTRFDCDWSSDVCSSDLVPMCMPHQMPTYFIGLIQLVFSMTLGGLRFRPSTDGARSVARSASWIVRHGVTNGVRPRTLIPSA